MRTAGIQMFWMCTCFYHPLMRMTHQHKHMCARQNSHRLNRTNLVTHNNISFRISQSFSFQWKWKWKWKSFNHVSILLWYWYWWHHWSSANIIHSYKSVFKFECEWDLKSMAEGKILTYILFRFSQKPILYD